MFSPLVINSTEMARAMAAFRLSGGACLSTLNGSPPCSEQFCAIRLNNSEIII